MPVIFTLNSKEVVPYHFRPFLFSDAERVLRDVAIDQRLLQRIARQPITLLWWVLDEGTDSYLFGLDGQAMEGPGYLLRYAGHFFEVGAEPFGNRAAFRQMEANLPVSAVLEAQSAFAEAIQIYGRGGQGPRNPNEIPLEPAWVSSL